jgi:hypothetical protein
MLDSPVPWRSNLGNGRRGSPEVVSFEGDGHLRGLAQGT